MESNGEAGIEGDASSPGQRRTREMRRAIDEVVGAEREIAAGYARRAAAVEKTRRLSAADAAANRSEAGTAGSRPRSATGWTFEATAWRELVCELACALRLPERTAETLIAHSQTLANELPSTLAALSAGQIGYRHVEKLIDHVYSIPESVRGRFEEAALPHACELTVAKFDKKARVIRERIHPESIVARTRTARDLRDVFCDPARDGMAYLTAYVPASVAIAGLERINDIATSLRSSDEPRTQAQLRADVFADLIIDGITDPVTMSMPTGPQYSAEEIPTLAEQHREELRRMGIDADLGEIMTDLQRDLDHHVAEQHRVWASLNGIGDGIAAKAMVTVPALTLLDRIDEPAVLEGYGPIDPQTARELAASAPSFTRILTHPETGATLSVGRDSYAVPADLKRLLQYRDETCRHPGCSKRVFCCDLDHSVDWLYGGDTAHDNLAHLCRGHHQLKHHTRWRYQHLDELGTLEFTSPAGRRYITRPASPVGTVRFE